MIRVSMGNLRVRLLVFLAFPAVLGGLLAWSVYTLVSSHFGRLVQSADGSETIMNFFDLPGLWQYGVVVRIIDSSLFLAAICLVITGVANKGQAWARMPLRLGLFAALAGVLLRLHLMLWLIVQPAVTFAAAGYFVAGVIAVFAGYALQNHKIPRRICFVAAPLCFVAAVFNLQLLFLIMRIAILPTALIVLLWLYALVLVWVTVLLESTGHASATGST